MAVKLNYFPQTFTKLAQWACLIFYVGLGGPLIEEAFFNATDDITEQVEILGWKYQLLLITLLVVLFCLFLAGVVWICCIMDCQNIRSNNAPRKNRINLNLLLDLISRMLE